MADIIGQEIGGYRILEQIGQGGMARVYKAYQPKMDRVVALKILPDLYAQDESAKARFRQEARIIASLEHTHILPVYDFGEEDETAFLVMRYLQAGNLKNLLAAAPNGRLSLPDSALLTNQIASALDYAHQKGIVHRDVKPANVLIDPHGQAFLTDFGIAKVLEGAQELTKTGSTLGTPAYMSPEQASGGDVDHRSDIYSLGIILYQMLTGQPPFKADTPYATIVSHIKEPLPLPRSINPNITPEVEDILLKSLAKDPKNRFQSAGNLSTTLRNTNAIIDTHTPEQSTSEQFQEISSSISTQQPAEDLTYDDKALLKDITRQKRQKKLLPWLLVSLLGLIVAGTWFTINQITHNSPLAANQETGSVLENTSTPLLSTASSQQVDQTSTQKKPVTTPTMSPKFLEMASSSYLGPRSEQIEKRIGKGVISELKINPSRNKVAIATSLGVYIYGSKSFNLLDFYEMDSWVMNLAWSPDGNKLAGGDRDGEIRIWDLDSHSVILRLDGHNDWIRSLTWSKKDDLLASGSNQGDIIVWDANTGEIVQSFTEHNSTIYSLDWNPQEDKLASSSYDKTVKIWSLENDTSTNTLELESSIATVIKWSPEGEYLAAGMRNGNINIFSADTGEVLENYKSETGEISQLAWTPTGKQLAVGINIEGIIQWDLNSGEVVTTNDSRLTGLLAITWTAEQTIIVYTNQAVFEIKENQPEELLKYSGHFNGINCLAWAPDGSKVVFGTDDNQVYLWDVENNTPVKLPPGHIDEINDLSWSSNGQLISSASADQTTIVWDAISGEILKQLEGHTGKVLSTAWSSDGSILATGSEDKTIILWDTTIWESKLIIDDIPGWVQTLVWPQGNDTIIAGLSNNQINFWETTYGRSTQTLQGHSSYISDIAFNPSTTNLASGSLDNSIFIWNPDTGTLLQTVNNLPGNVNSVAWNSEYLIAGSSNSILICDPLTGEIVNEFIQHNGVANSVDVSSVGNLIASGSEDGTIILWDMTKLIDN